MCDLWNGFGQPTSLFGWGCTNNVPTNAVCLWSNVNCDSCNVNVVLLMIESVNLVGTLSPSIGELTALTFLAISSDSLHGSIPSTITALTLLASLNLGYNLLTGTIPSQVGDLTALNFFYLSTNSLHGTIPNVFQNMASLSAFDVSSNQLTGYVPASICGRSTTALYTNNNPNLIACSGDLKP